MRPYEDGAAQQGSKVFAPRHQFGRYEIVRVLGSGAFAAVYEAYDPALDATVAVKVLGDHHCGDADIRSRFINEARLLRRGIGDRLIPVYDIGEQDGQPFFVMELLPLGTLGDRLGALGRPVSFAAARRVADELGGCLNALHSAGIVHRDLKPSNLLMRNTAAVPAPANPAQLLAPSERLVLGDFGIARDADASNLTMAGGTIGYMSPEQYTPSADIDHRADIFAASAIVTAVLTGRLQPPHPKDLPAVVPDNIRNALASGMAASPDDRPQSAQEWHQLMMWAIPDSNESIPSQLPTSAPYPSTGPERPPAAPQNVDGGNSLGATAAFGAPVSGDTRPLGSGVGGGMLPNAQTQSAGLPSTSGGVASTTSAKPSFGLPQIAGGVVVALLVLGGLLFGVSRFFGGSSGDLVITGEENITVGSSELYQPAVRKQGASYVWETTLAGQAINTPALTITPDSEGVVEITLTETLVDGETTQTAELKVSVEAP